MKHTLKLVLGLVLAAASFGVPTTAHAQDQQDKIIPSIDLDQADVRDALKIIFKVTGYDYSVDAAVQGTVTVHLENKTFEVVLRNVLNQVGATYRIEALVYVIVPRPVPTQLDPRQDPIAVAPSIIVRRIPVNKADPALIIALLSGNSSIGSSPERTLAGGGGGGIGGGGGFGGQGGGFGGQGGGFGGGFGGQGGGFGGQGGGFGGGGFGGGSGGGFGGGSGGGRGGGGFGGGGRGGGGLG